MAVAQEGSFGARLRRLREAAGLTQEELASRAGLSSDAVSRLERGQRRRPYQHTVRALADSFDLSEDEREALIASAPSAQAWPSPRRPRVRVHSPPPHSARGSRARPARGKGPPRSPRGSAAHPHRDRGVGKTRLAVEAARDVAESFPDGVTFVDLASLGDAALVLSAISQSLGLRETGDRPLHEAIQMYLREKRLLLLLDNFEHLLEAAPEGAPRSTVKL